MDFIVFKTFRDEETAVSLYTFLQKKGVDTQLTRDRSRIDFIYGVEPYSEQLYVKVRSTDIEKANRLMLDWEDIDVLPENSGYYLYAFTNEQLKEVLTTADEWSSFNVVMAKSILQERGEVVSDTFIEQMKEQRLKELSHPEKISLFWIVAGYVAALLVGILGAIMGLSIATAKKTLPDGTRVYTYTQKQRMHGKVMCIIGCLVFTYFAITTMIRLIKS